MRSIVILVLAVAYGFIAPSISSAQVSTPVINDLNANPSGLSQAAAPFYGPAFTLLVNGQNFVAASQASLGSTALATTFISTTQLMAAVPASALAVAGVTSVRVTNPGPLVSNAVSFRITEHGDINGSRSLNIGDALVIALTVGGVSKPPLVNAVGDINLNGIANIGDALALALFAGRANPNMPAPTITLVSPSPASTGAVLTITGTGFSSTAADHQVLFTTAGQDVVRVIPTTATSTVLTVTIPNEAISGPIQVFRSDIPLGSQEFPLLLGASTPDLALTSVAPFDQVAPGSSITLTGLGFDLTPSNNAVLFRAAGGTVAGTVTAATATSLTATVPASALCGDVTVSTGGKTSNGRTLKVQGTVCPFSLTDILGGGFAGDILVLEGAGFDVATPSNNIVRFSASSGTVIAPVIMAGSTQLHVRIPATVIDGNITVEVASQTSAPFPFRVASPTSPGSIDVIVSSATAVGSYQATIGYDKNIVALSTAAVTGGTGAGFTSPPTTINIDNSVGTVTLNHYQIGNSPTGTFPVAKLVFTPVGVGTSNLTLAVAALTDTNGNDLPRPPADVRLSSSSISVSHLPATPPPTLTSISSSTGFKGSSLIVMLTGSNFVAGSTTVSAGNNIAASSINVLSGTALNVTLTIDPAAATGPRNITVTTPAGTSEPVSFTVMPQPTATSITPDSGSQSQSGIGLTIAGSDLGAITGIQFSAGGIPDTAMSVSPLTAGASQITASLAIGASAIPGAHTLVLIGESGTVSTAVTFTVNAAPAQTLTVTKLGTGVGTVTSVPAGINCGAACSFTFTTGTTVALTASPNSTTNFTGWGGVCSGVAACSLTMDSAKAVTATFQPKPQPTINSLVPAFGFTGGNISTLLINGSDFDLFPSPPVVVFIPVGSNTPETRFVVSNLSVANAGIITLSVQPGSTASPVTAGYYRVEVRDTVTSPQLKTQSADLPNVNLFQVLPPAPLPSLVSVNPGAGVQGSTARVTLIGTNFIAGATTVNISGSGVTIPALNVVNPTTISALVVLSGSAGPRTVTVTTPGGTSSGVTLTINANAISSATELTATTFAGQVGNAAFADGIGLQARFSSPMGVSSDGTSLYVADTSNHRIRKVDLITGGVTTLAGSGIPGFADGTGSGAQFNSPNGLWTDGTSVYVADTANHSIRRIEIATGVVTTVAGSAGVPGTSDGTGANARFNSPTGIWGDGRALYVADTNNHTIRRVDPVIRTVITLAGVGAASGSADGTATIARFRNPQGIWGSDSRLYVADSANHTIRQITIATGDVATLAGSGGLTGTNNGVGALARFSSPQGLWGDGTNLYVADRDNQTIRRIEVASATVSTIAGNAGAIGSADATGILARFSFPGGVAGDGNNLYVADVNNQTIRKLNVTAPLGVITTVAGNGVAGYTVDGQLATLSALNNPRGVAFDSAGNLYIADSSNGLIRKVTTAGVISMVAGGGSSGLGDGGAATAAQLSNPTAMLFDPSDNMYILDTGNHRIRKVSPLGIISTFAGTTNGFSGDGGPAASAQLSSPNGFARDTAGNFYVADSGNQRIRKITSTGTISTFAGTGTQGFGGDGGPATVAQFFSPSQVVVDSSGNLYIGDTGNGRIRKVTTDGIINTIAGGGSSNNNGPALSASLVYIWGLVVDGSGNLYVSLSDSGIVGGFAGWYEVRRISPNGLITTIAGSPSRGFSGDNGLATAAQLGAPTGLALDAAGNLYIADYSNQRIRKVSPVTDQSATATQMVIVSGNNQTAGIGVTLANPLVVEVRNATGNPVSGVAVAFASADGTVSPTTIQITGANGRAQVVAKLGYTAGPQQFVADSGVASVVFAATATTLPVTSGTLSVIATVAGNGISGYTVDGQLATLSSLYNPRGVAFDSAGNLYIADSSNGLIRKVTTAGVISTVAGGGSSGLGDGGAATAAQLSNPTAVLFDPSDNMYILDTGNHRIRKVSTVGIITTFAGSTNGFSGDGGPAAAAQLSSPTGFARDAAGNFYVADSGNHRIRKITSTGTIGTIAGFGTSGFSGDGGSALLAQLSSPREVVVDSSGSVYFGDQAGTRIRKLTTDGMINTIAGGGSANNNGPAVLASLAYIWGLVVDGSGNLYVSLSDSAIVGGFAGWYEVRRISPNGLITTIAGNPSRGFSGDNGLATAAQLGAPTGLALDAAGNLYIADYSNHRIRKVSAVADQSATATQMVIVSGNNQTAGMGVTLANPLVVEVRNAANNPVSGVAVAFASAAGTVSPATIQITGASGRVQVVAKLGNTAGTQQFVADSGVASVVFAATATTLPVTSGTLSVIATVAGNGVSGYTVDGQLATLSSLYNPRGVAFDSAGNLYIADSSNGLIRKVTTAGLISTVAGGGSSGLGDGGAATAAQLSNPTAVLFDPSDNMYILDTGSHRIRKVSTVGIITTFAGTTNGFSGDGGLAASAQLSSPTGFARDAAGNFYVADSGNHRIRKITSTGTIGTIAGFGTSGFSGDGGSALLAQLSSPREVVVDSSGSVYFGDQAGTRIRKLTTDGIINTIAGGGSANNTGPAVLASLAYIWGLVIDGSGNLYVSLSDSGILGGSTGWYEVRRISPNGLITTIAGNPSRGFSGDNGLATAAQLGAPTGLALDAAGNLYIADYSNHRIRKVSPVADQSATATQMVIVSGNNQTAGIGVTLANPLVVEVRNAANNPVSGVAVAFASAAGTVSPTTSQITGANGRAQIVAKLGNTTGTQQFVADIGVASVVFSAIATGAPAVTGTISTVAGAGSATFTGDNGQATAATINAPRGVAFDTSGNMYIVDTGNARIRKVATDGVITTVAGGGSSGLGDNGAATSAQLSNPTAVITDSSGNLYIADTGNQRIRKVSSAGTITTIAGTGTPGFSGDGGSATLAQLNNPIGLARDAAGNIYVADSANQRIRQITTAGTISTVAGFGTPGYSGDGGAAVLAQLSSPTQVALDGSGNLYIADQGTRIRKVATDGVISTIAGGGSSNSTGPAVLASLAYVWGLTVDGSGSVYVSLADSGISGGSAGWHEVRRISPNGLITTIAGNASRGFSGDNGSATAAQLNAPTGLALDAAGNLYIADYSNNCIRKVVP